jgi:hypothetical protein
MKRLTALAAFLIVLLPATDPHLDYRMRRGGQFVDPLRLEAPPATPVPEGERAAFEERLRRWAALLGEATRVRTASR